MKVAQFPKAIGEKVKSFVVKNDLADTSYRMDKDDHFLYLAIKDECTEQLETEFSEIVYTEKELQEIKRESTKLRDVLKGKLPDDVLANVKTAFDTVGDIAILEIDEEMREHEKVIAETLLSLHKNINVVARKDGAHEGEFRTQNMKVLAGEDRLETIHMENGVRMRLDVSKVYFSARLCTERMRIAKMVQKDERVLVMFCGCAPYVCVIGKVAEPAGIIGVEKNPDGYNYGCRNVGGNRIKNTRLYNEDVRDIVPELGEFDRILMPLPKDAADFLDIALGAAKKGTVIHMYDFLHEKEFDTAKEKIKTACERNNLSYEIRDLVKCGQHAPYVYRICVDFIIN